MVHEFKNPIAAATSLNVNDAKANISFGFSLGEHAPDTAIGISATAIRVNSAAKFTSPAL